jgi:hypothetical protein
MAEALRSKKVSAIALLMSLRDCALGVDGLIGLPLEVIRLARGWKDTVIDRNQVLGPETRSRTRNRRPLPKTVLGKRITALVAEKKLSAASNLLEQYAEWYPGNGVSEEQYLEIQIGRAHV